MELTGKIIYETFAAGSKSESARPYLETSDGNKILLYKKDDNPFENSSLAEFDGKNARITGEIKDGAFVAESVEAVVSTTSTGSGQASSTTTTQVSTSSTTEQEADK